MAKNVPPRVDSTTLDDLVPVARRLNSSSDDLNVALTHIEQRLNELGLGIALFVPIPDTREVLSNGEHDNEEWVEYQVGYDRLGEGWALLTRRAHFHDDPTDTLKPEECWEFDEEKPLLRSSRELRIKAVEAIPELLKNIKADAEHVLDIVEKARLLAGDERAHTIEFEFGESRASNAFWDRNPTFWPAFERLLSLTNRVFGRQTRSFHNRVEDIGFNLGQTCRDEFFEIAFVAVNGHGIAAQKLLRGLYERAVTLEYIRQHPDKAERFVRYAAIQEFKAAKKALEVVPAEQFDSEMALSGTSFEQMKQLHDEVKPEFQVTACKKCGTTQTAFSWDIDMASMVNKLGEPYKHLFLGSYSLPTLHIHATLASAFSREAVVGTPQERKIHDAEFALLSATLVFVAVLRSQNKLFSLGLDSDIDACWNEVETVWRDRPHGPRAKRAVQSQG
jgi:hypothetical protein